MKKIGIQKKRVTVTVKCFTLTLTIIRLLKTIRILTKSICICLNRIEEIRHCLIMHDFLTVFEIMMTVIRYFYVRLMYSAPRQCLA